jgi:hypothetical protein
MNPEQIADQLLQLLKAKMPNGSFVVKKEHRITVIKAEILLRKMK